MAMYSVATQPAMLAGMESAKRMPSFMHMAAMCMASAASIIFGTGVVTSVSLFALTVSTLLLALLGVLLSLSGLTGLLSLVGLITGLDPGTVQGD
jgi:hypothetical protein